MKKSISELEGWFWKGEIPNRNTYSSIICRFYELHNKPISELENKDIRFLIGQNFGLVHLVPIVLEILKRDIFIETEYFVGDLLIALLQININTNYFETHKNEKEILTKLFLENQERFSNLETTFEIRNKIIKLFKNFTS